jgi:hypothetical protein
MATTSATRTAVPKLFTCTLSIYFESNNRMAALKSNSKIKFILFYFTNLIPTGEPGFTKIQ